MWASLETIIQNFRHQSTRFTDNTVYEQLFQSYREELRRNRPTSYVFYAASYAHTHTREIFLCRCLQIHLHVTLLVVGSYHSFVSPIIKSFVSFKTSISLKMLLALNLDPQHIYYYLCNVLKSAVL